MSKQLFYRERGSGETAERYYISVELVEERHKKVMTRFGEIEVTAGNYIARHVENPDAKKLRYGDTFGVTQADLDSLYKPAE